MADEEVVLYNKGKRVIQTEAGNFKPGVTGKFPKAIADKLRKLFPSEVQSIDDAVQVFKEHVSPAEPAQASESPKKPVVAARSSKDFPDEPPV